MKILCPPDLKIHHLSEDEVREKYGIVEVFCSSCSICGKISPIKRISTYNLLPYERDAPCSCRGFTLPPLRNYHYFDSCSDEILLDFSCLASRRVRTKLFLRKAYISLNLLSHAIFELKYRGLLPSINELSVAMDFCIEQDIDVSKLTFLEVWREYKNHET